MVQLRSMYRVQPKLDFKSDSILVGHFLHFKSQPNLLFTFDLKRGNRKSSLMSNENFGFAIQTEFQRNNAFSENFMLDAIRT